MLGISREDLMEGRFATKDNSDMSKLKHPIISGFKGNIGHLNLASGITEANILLKCMEADITPGIYGLVNPIDEDLTFAMH